MTIDKTLLTHGLAGVCKSLGICYRSAHSRPRTAGFRSSAYLSFQVTVTRASSVSVPASTGTKSAFALPAAMAMGRGPP
jgi:hypothetical protein